MPASWGDSTDLLCVRLDEMGDLLMTAPALRALRSRGRRRITVLTSRSGASVARCIPEIDDVIVHEAPWVKSAPAGCRGQDDLDLVQALHRRKFDGALVFTVFSQNPLPSAYLCYLAGIPQRAAYCRENPYQLLTHWVKEVDEPPRVRHEVRRQLDLVAALGFTTDDESLSLTLPPGARAAAEAALGNLGLDRSNAWVLVHPGASAPSRRYPPEHFAAVADMLVDEGLAVVFTGAGEEVELVEGVRSLMNGPSLSLAGRLSIEELFGVIDDAPLLVSNNTGPAHAAAALGTPVVVTYAQTNLQHTPWTEAVRVLWHDVPCKFCLKSVCPEGHHDCLRLVHPQAVVRAALELLAAPPRGGAVAPPALRKSASAARPLGTTHASAGTPR